MKAINKKAVNKVFLGQENKGKGRYFKSRFIEAGLVQYDFGLCLLSKENLDKFVQGFVGCPVIIEHNEVYDDNAKELRVGAISRVWFDDADGYYWCEGIIWDERALDLIINKGWSVSCQYDITEVDEKGGIHNGVEFDKTILNGSPEHLALVDAPRYEAALIAVNSGKKKFLFNKAINSDFKEEEHPRDEKGKFTDGRGKSFKEQIKDIETGQASDKTLLNVLDKPSRVWKDAGLPDKPLVMSAGVYKKATETKHNVDKTTIERLPELIQDPLYIFKSSTQPNSFVGVLDAVENKEKSDGQLIVAIKPGQNGLEVNIITSTYGKDKDFINRELNKGNLLYKKTGVSNRKASIALKVDNLSNTIITDIQANFNPDIANYKAQNNKEIEEMGIVEDLEKLILKAKNKGDSMKSKNEDTDKRKLIDEVAGMMKSAGADDELIRTAIAKMEKLAYDKSEVGTADNKAKNEDEEDEKEEAKNKCRNEEDCGKKDEKADNKCRNKDEDEDVENEDEDEYDRLKREVDDEAKNKAKNKARNSISDFKKSFYDYDGGRYDTGYISQKKGIELGKQVF